MKYYTHWSHTNTGVMLIYFDIVAHCITLCSLNVVTLFHLWWELTDEMYFVTPLPYQTALALFKGCFIHTHLCVQNKLRYYYYMLVAVVNHLYFKWNENAHMQRPFSFSLVWSTILLLPSCLIQRQRICFVVG